MTTITNRQREILRHALGLDRADEPYRDRYCAAFDSPEEADCERLVQLGLMTELTPIDLVPYHAFRVTDRGRQIALEDHTNA